MKENEELITPNEFKARYGTALPTQFIWRRDKKVPFIKVDRSILYDQSVTDALAFDGKFGKDPLLAIMKIKQNEETA